MAKKKRSPLIIYTRLGQRCIRLCLNLKATFLTKNFAVEDFATGVAHEVNETLDGLVEKK